MRNLIYWIVFIGVIPFSAAMAADEQADKLARVNHIIVFFLENHSFDSLYGTFPGADGFADADGRTVQVDEDGKIYRFLPRVMDDGKPDRRFPEKLPNKPFLITKYVPDSQDTGDMVHRFYQMQAQIDNGKMDKFVSEGDSGGLVMGYYEDRNSPLWEYARNFTLADHFFMAAFGGSFLNHMWLICACTPRYENAPVSIRAVLDANGRLVKDGAVTPDGYAVNTINPFGWPYDKKVKDAAKRLPPQNTATIGDRLSEKNIDWVWYSGGWKKADAGHPEPSFVFFHQPFAFYARYAHGTQERKKHLKDENDFIAAIEKGELPPVSFYKPIGEFDLHPDYSNLKSSQDYVFTLIQKIQHSPAWKDSIIIVTFDDSGGFFDHVAPPKGDRFGPGVRVPTIIISPFAKRGFIDHTPYDTTSILRLIERKYGLEPLGERDAHANDLLNSLE